MDNQNSDLADAGAALYYSDDSYVTRDLVYSSLQQYIGMEGATSGQHNQTGSTNDSKDDSSNQVSSPSAPRGFSSDEGSGWRSETETSDGNLSLSQYPLDDKSGEDSAHDGGSINDEALSTAITEVSKDFISGNFSPMRCLVSNGDSDSNSDGDHKGPHADPKGAVYANYPESATGMSDVEWNPYESDFNPEPTPRSSESDGPARNPILDTMASICMQWGKDSGYDNTQTFDTLTGGSQNTNNSAATKSGSDTGTSEDSVKASGSSQQTTQQFYSMFAEQNRDEGIQVTGSEDQKLVRRDSGEFLPESQLDNGNGEKKDRKLEMPTLVLRKSGDDMTSDRASAVREEMLPESRFFRVISASDSNVGHTRPSGADVRDSADTYLPPVSSDSAPNPREGAYQYIPVSDRERLITLPPGNPETRVVNQDKDTVGNNTADVPQSVPKSNSLTQLGDAQSRVGMSQRVTKLLDDASSLGAALHKQLYSKEALGLGQGDQFDLPKERPVLESRPEMSSDRPCPIESRPPPPPYDVVQAERKIDDIRESLENQSRSLGSVGSNPDNVSRSEQSMTSSLGEEVAKLLVKNEPSGIGAESLKLDLKSITGETDLSSESLAELEALQRFYRQERETEKLLEETRARLGSARSTDSSDSLGQRVQNVLARTAYVDKMQYPLVELHSSESESHVPTSINYTRLQKDLQDIQNSLKNQARDEPYSREGSRARVSDMDRSGDSFSSNAESARNRKLLWDHSADFGIDMSGSGAFLGTMKNDTETETDTLGLTSFGQTGNGESRHATNDCKSSPDTEGQDRKVDVIDDQLNSDTELDTEGGNLVPDVEEIIRRYQSKNAINNPLDDSGLASRVFTILTKEPPQKQVFGILEEAMQQERVMMERIANRPKMDSSYDSYDSPDGSFIVQDRDVKKHLEWSQMSSLNGSAHPDKTGMSELSFLKDGKHAPFNALGNAQKYLSSQIQKSTDRTFDHSINLRTPCRQVIDCYPVYGEVTAPNDPRALGSRAPNVDPRALGGREAWPDRGTERADNPVDKEEEEVYSEIPRSPIRPQREQNLQDMVTPQLANERFFITDLDNLPAQLRDSQRRYSDPRDLSPDFRMSPDRERRVRSRSEEAAPLDHDGVSVSLTDRRQSSSPQTEDVRPSSSKSRLSRSGSDRQETYGGNSPQPARKKKRLRRHRRADGSPASGTGVVISPNDSDSSSRRREGARLRPYRPYGSRELYYTEDHDDSGSLGDSITTAESTHTGSDDAVGPSFPTHYLGSRADIPKSDGVYSNHQPLSEGLSTIDEKSLVDERDKSGTDSGVDRRSVQSGSSRGDNPGHSHNPASMERRPDSGLELRSGRPGRWDRDQVEVAPRDRPSSAELRSRSNLPLEDRDFYYRDQERRVSSGDDLRPDRRFPKDDVGRDRMTADGYRDSLTSGQRYSYRNHGLDRSGLERPGLTSVDVQPKDRVGNIMEGRDDPLSVTTRSDPGDIFTPRAGGDSELSVYPLDRLSEGQNHYLQDPVGVIRSRSKSETDLIDLSAESHRNSSPLTNTRLMDLSCQPSPIFSHHTTLDSPALPGNRETQNLGRAEANIAKYMAERILQRPLEKGKDLASIDKPDNLDKELDYNPRLRSRLLEPGEGFIDLEARDIYRAPAGEENYRSGPVRDEYKNPRDIVNEGSRPTGDPREGYRPTTGSAGETNPVEYIAQAERQRLMSPTWANPRANPPEAENRVEITANYCDKTGQPLDHGYSPGADRPLEPGVQRPLEPGAGLLVRPLEPGSDASDRRKKESATTRDTVYVDPSGEQFKELEQMPDSDFEEAINEEQDRILEEKREKILRDLELKARSQHKFVPLVDNETSEYDEEFDRRPPSKRVQILQRSLEKEYQESVHPDINGMWQRFRDHSTASESSLNTPRMDKLNSLIQNPTKHVVQKYMDDVTYERAKEGRLMKELAATLNNEESQEQTERKQEGDKLAWRRREEARLRREVEYRRKISGDDDSNGSYAEILAQQGEKKRAEKEKKNKDNKKREPKSSKSQNSKMADSTDTLYSIPEDTSFEVATPSKMNDSELLLKAKRNRRRHIIDPLMDKLHTKVKQQRDKIDKERKKETRRMDKLKKLEMLLSAKQKGKLSDKAIDVELDMVSSTTSISLTTDSSTLIDTDSTLTSRADSNMAVADTTSSKDSSLDIHYPSPSKNRQVAFQERVRVPTRVTGPLDDSESQQEDSIFHRPFTAKPRCEKTVHEKKHKKGKKVKTADIFQEPKISIGNKENVERFLAQMQDNDIYRDDFRKLRKSSSSPSSRKYKSVATMFPSPLNVSPPHHRSRKSGRVKMVSEAVQTSPYVPSHSERRVIPVPLMSPERRRKHFSPSPSRSKSRSSSRSPIRQRSANTSVATSVSPARSRSRSHEDQRTTSFDISMSPERPNVQGKSRKARSPSSKQNVDYGYTSRDIPPPKSRMFTPETPEDTCVAKLKDSPNRGVSWYIPIAESRPWRQPFKEQQAHAVRQKPWQPKSIHSADWKAMVGSNILNKSRDTKFDLDPRGHLIGGGNVEVNSSDEENYDPKPLNRMSLQEAFKYYKQGTISHVGERQKRVMLAAHERQLQHYLDQERNQLFDNQVGKKESNPDAHPYSENLHKPKRRSMSKKEMKQITKRLYKKLPEVQAMKYVKKRDDDYSLNRLRAKVFNRKIQRDVLQKVAVR